MERLRSLLRGECTSHVLPFLWMKGEENAVIGRELDKIEACGIREVCLESRPHPDFCGPGWWENLDYICAQAQRRGMKLWILDDDKFPTGHANGGFERQPGKKKYYLAERHMDIYGPCRSGAVLVKNFIGSGGKLLGILAVPKPDGETLAVSGHGILNLTDRYENGFVYFDLPEGPYRLFVLFITQKGGGRDGYMNLIDSESVRVLIDEVYEKHYERYGAYFGNTIAGFFSDEPELGNVTGYPFDDTLGRKDQRLPWSGELEEILRDRWGDDFLYSLPALWYDSGEKTSAVRSAYMDEMTGLVKKCFSAQVGNWCREHGVEYIGHVIEDDNAHARMGCSVGHYFREMEGQHMAGVDVVHHQIVPGFTEPVHQWIAGDRDGEFFHFALAKLASSAAHIQENKKGRALCEIFGNYGWAEGNSLMKWLTNHMLVRGINEFTPHAFSMRYPDTDCPPHFYAEGNNPGFACFTWLMKYMNRSAHLLSGGIHVADAAVLYHAESEWSGGKTQLFQKPGRKLMESQLDYDVIPADVLGAGAEVCKGTDAGNGSGVESCADKKGCPVSEGFRAAGSGNETPAGGRMPEEARRGQDRMEEEVHRGRAWVQDGWLCIREERYPCLILPYAQYLDVRVIRFVEENAPEGLKVYVIEALPQGDTCGGPLPEGWERHVEVTALKDIAEKVAALADSMGGRELVVAEAQEDLESVGTAESSSAEPGRRALGSVPHLRSLVVRQPDGLAAMYFNESVSRKVHARVLVKNPCYGKVTVYDPWRNRAEIFALREGSIPLALDPGEAVFYCLEKAGEVPAEEQRTVCYGEHGAVPPEEPGEVPSGECGEIQPGEAEREFPVLAGQRLLDVDWKISKAELPEELPQGEFMPDFREAAVIKAGEQLSNLNAPGYWPSFVGYYRYETHFTQERRNGRRYLLVLPEASDSVQILLNGVDMGFLAGFPARLDITETLEDGENSLTLDVATTLVWRRKDGASTHLQVPASGITGVPVIEWYE